MELKEKLNPEIIIESIVSYVNQAAAVLKKRPEKIKKKKYRYLFIPSGPQYYCGILQAMSYLLLDKHFAYKKTLFVITDSKLKKDINSFDEEINYLGIKINEGVKGKRGKLTKQLKETIQGHSGFIRTLTLDKTFSRTCVSPNITRTKLKKTIEQTKYKNHNIAFIGSLNQNEELLNCMEKDKGLLTKILQGKSIYSQKKKVPNLYNFSKCCQVKKKEVDIIAYLNSGQMGAEERDCTGYACILA